MKPVWQQIIDGMPVDAQKYLLKAILKTRKKYFSFSLNFQTQQVPRYMVRDYLKERYPKVKQ